MITSSHKHLTGLPFSRVLLFSYWTRLNSLLIGKWKADKVTTNFPTSLLWFPETCQYKHLHCRAIVPLLMNAERKSLHRHLLLKSIGIHFNFTVSLIWYFLKLEPVLIERELKLWPLWLLSVAVSLKRQSHFFFFFFKSGKAFFSRGLQKFFPLPKVDYTSNYPTKQEIRHLGISESARN